MSGFFEPLTARPRRLRRTSALRALVRQTHLRAEQMVMPLFVRAGVRGRVNIPSMPGQAQWSVEDVVAECRRLREAGVGAVLLFGVPDGKDARGSRAYAADGIVPRAVRAIKARVPGLLVMTDVCLCAYTTHGHCGVLKTSTVHHPQSTEVEVDNDATLELLAKVALSHARAGADLVAPSDMMDGTVGVIRRALDGARFASLPILAYAVKYASALYAPFRHAAGSAPQRGDRRSYQLDVANLDEALHQVRLHLAQGADLIMVKPALPSLDILHQVKRTFRCPVAAFGVSGEYAMVKAACARGWLDERAVVLELLVSMKRAGADVLVTYWAKDAAQWLRA